MTDATVTCWGYNLRGQLGLGDTTDRTTPTTVTALGTSVAQLVLDGLHQ